MGNSQWKELGLLADEISLAINKIKTIGVKNGHIKYDKSTRA